MKKEGIQKIINWSEQAINVAELESYSAIESTDYLFKELREIIKFCKDSGLTLKEIQDNIWNYTELAAEIFNEV